MRFNIPLLFIVNSILFAGAAAFESDNEIHSTQYNLRHNNSRRLQTNECVLLLKAIKYEDQTESEEVDCYDEETDTYSRITSKNEEDDEMVQKQLLSRFKSGKLQSSVSTMLQRGSYFEDGSLKLQSKSLDESIFSKRAGEGRKLATSGSNKYVVVRVNANDSVNSNTESFLRDKWFGTSGDPFTYKSQVEACSYNKVTVVPYSGNGVSGGAMSLNVNTNAKGQSNDKVASKARTTLSSSIRSSVDHYAFCLPAGTLDSWIGWAYVNHKMSVFNAGWCNKASLLIHEIGHNWNLRHSGEKNIYDDQTGLMGYSYNLDNGPRMCFNAPKSSQLGWYSDREIVVREGWAGKLYGVASYTQATKEDAVILKIPSGTNNKKIDTFISFNGKKGINGEVVEYSNKVLIHTRSYATAKSDLIQTLGSGSVSLTSSLSVNVVSILGSDYAIVEIGNGKFEDSFDDSCGEPKSRAEFTKGDKRRVRKCSWVAKRTRNRCKKWQHAKQFCPVTCAAYGGDCAADATGLIELSKGGEMMSCNDITDQTKAKLCSNTVISSACRASCKDD